MTLSDDRTFTRASAWGFTTEPEEWRKAAVCAQTDADAFFPDKGGSTREAKQVCLGCDVRAECLQYALDNDERFGIWGGYSERERRLLKRGQQVPITVTNKPNLNANGHGHACKCVDCQQLREARA